MRKRPFWLFVYCFAAFLLCCPVSSIVSHAEGLDGNTYTFSDGTVSNYFYELVYREDGWDVPVLFITRIYSEASMVFYYDQDGRLRNMSVNDGWYFVKSWYEDLDGNLGSGTSGTSTIKKYDTFGCSFGYDNFVESKYVSCSDGAMVFDSYESAVNYIDTGDTNGQVNKGPINLDFEGILNQDFEIPYLSVDSIGYEFGFNNGADGIFFEMKGRWYSVDDIELFKDNLVWKYKYSTYIKSPLTTWVSVEDHALSTSRYNFTAIGGQSFDDFINSYPVDSRTYTGGSNVLGNWLGGYNDALNQIKLLLGEPTSIYNGVEVYVRYYYYDDNDCPVYSKWTHYYDNLANAAGSSGSTWDDKYNIFTENQSQSGITSDMVDSLENTGNSRNDVDALPKYNNNTNYFDKSEGLYNATSDFMNLLSGMFSGLGQFPALINQLFGYLPVWLTTLIALGLGSVVILRFIGR